MGRVFSLDSPFMNFFNKVADLIWLNILAMLCCIPVITIGATMTAVHYVVLKMAKDEEGYVTKSFFKSFKLNFRQATLIWLILLAIIFVLAGDFLIFRYSEITFPGWFPLILLAAVLILLLSTMYLFPLLSRYENSIGGTFKNSLLMGFLNLPKTVLMMVCWLIPLAAVLFLPPMLPITFLLGISGPAFLNALLYKKSFQRFEPDEEQVADEDWTIAEEPDAEQEAKAEADLETAEPADSAAEAETETETGQAAKETAAEQAAEAVSELKAE